MRNPAAPNRTAQSSLYRKDTVIRPPRSLAPSSRTAVPHEVGAVPVTPGWLDGSTTAKERGMSHVYQLNSAVLHRGQGPQGRVQVEEPKIYKIVQRLPIESDGLIRYRIKSDKIERVVTEDEISYYQ